MSEHKWEFGDWGCEHNYIIRYVGMNEGMLRFIWPDGSTGRRSNDSAIEYLPDCTGWDWKPRPTDPGDGYRFVAYPEAPEAGDEYWSNVTSRWKLRASDTWGKLPFTLTDIYRRKLPQIVTPKYRPFANGEEFKPFRDKWWRFKLGAAVGQNCAPASFSVDSHGNRSWQQRFDECEFEDGTPFGLPVSEDDK